MNASYLRFSGIGNCTNKTSIAAIRQSQKGYFTK